MSQRDYYRKRLQRKTIEGYFYIDGKRIRRTICNFSDIGLDDTGQPISKNKRALNQIENQLLARYQQLEIKLNDDSKTKKPISNYPLLQEALQAWLDNIRNERTKINYSKSANLYLEAVGNCHIDLIPKKGEGKAFLQVLDDYRLVRKVIEYKISETTKATYFTHIQSFWNWAEYEYELPKSVKLSNRPKATKKLPITLSSSQKSAVYHYIKSKFTDTIHGRDKKAYQNHLRAFIISQEAYLRAGEIIRLKISHIDLENRFILILDESGKGVIKGGHEERVPINSTLLIFIKNDLGYRNEGEIYWLDSGQGAQSYPNGTGSLGRSIKKHMLKCGVNEKIKPLHCGRFTGATEIAQLSNNSYYVQKALRHKDQKTSSFYVDTSQIDIRNVMEKTSKIKKNPQKLEPKLEPK
jgi:integrase